MTTPSENLAPTAPSRAASRRPRGVHQRLWGFAFGQSARPAWMEKPSTALTIAKTFVIVAISLSVIVPMLVVISTSFASGEQIRDAGGYVLFPTDPTLEAYETIFASPLVFRSLGVSVFVTVVGTLLALFVTICMASDAGAEALYSSIGAVPALTPELSSSIKGLADDEHAQGVLAQSQNSDLVEEIPAYMYTVGNALVAQVWDGILEVGDAQSQAQTDYQNLSSLGE